jgi:hypothetical protein
MILGLLLCCFNLLSQFILSILYFINNVYGLVSTPGPLSCCRHALAPFNTAMQLEASCSPNVENPLMTCFCLFICFVIVALLSPYLSFLSYFFVFFLVASCKTKLRQQLMLELCGSLNIPL